MKKKILFLVLLIVASYTTINAQIGAMVVEDPVNASINTSIATLNETSVALQAFMNQTKVLEMATSGVESLNTIKEIGKLVDDLVCLSSEFNFYMNIQETYSCAKFLNFRLININLGYTTELLNGVILARNIFTMSSSERLNNLNRIKDVLEKTIKDMQIINSSLKTITVQRAYTNYVKKTYTANPEKTIAFNRYKDR